MELTASFPSAYMSSSDLWIRSPESANLPFVRPFLWKTCTTYSFFPFSGLPNFRAILRILRKHCLILNLADAKNTSVCSTAERHKKLRVSRNAEEKRLPALWGSDGRWFVWTLHLFFGWFQQCCGGVCCGVFFSGAGSLNFRKSMNLLILSKRLSPKKTSEYTVESMWLLRSRKHFSVVVPQNMAQELSWMLGSNWLHVKHWSTWGGAAVVKAGFLHGYHPKRLRSMKV